MSSSSSESNLSSCSINKSQEKDELFKSVHEKTKRKESKRVQFVEEEKEVKKLHKSMKEVILHEEQEKKENDIKLKSILSFNIDFEILSFLGKGAFGRVYLARRINTIDLYALKLIPVQEGKNEKDIEMIKNQHEIFRKIGGDHLVKAPFSFSEYSGHFFVLEYMPGGDLGKILEEETYLE